MKPMLGVERSLPGRTLVDRGPLLSPDQAAALFPEGARPSLQWVRKRIRPRVKIGRLVLFYQRDVEAFIATHRESA